MIKNMSSLSMAESNEYLDKSSIEVKSFVKNFVSLKPAEAKRIRETILGLGLIKLNDKHISKIIDFMPIDKEELNKVLSDVNLDENETNAILDTIKQYK